MRCFDGAWRRAFPGLRLCLLQLLLGAANAFKVSINLNTYTSVELAYATRHFTTLNGTLTITINSWHNGSATLPDDAQWRAALAAIGSEQFSAEMWPCSEAANAEWHCSDITQVYDASKAGLGECNVVRQLAPKGELAGAFAYHEVGPKPHTALTWEEIDEVSSACGGCKVLLHTRRYSGPWKEEVDRVLAHPLVRGVVFERGAQQLPIADLGSFAEAMLAAGKEPFFLLPFKALGKFVTGGMTAAEQMHRFLRFLEAHSSASVLEDPRVNIVIARYGTGLPTDKPPPFPPPSPTAPPPPPPAPPSPHRQIPSFLFLPVFGDGNDTVAAAVAVALLARDKRDARRHRELRDSPEPPPPPSLATPPPPPSLATPPPPPALATPTPPPALAPPTPLPSAALATTTPPPSASLATPPPPPSASLATPLPSASLATPPPPASASLATTTPPPSASLATPLPSASLATPLPSASLATPPPPPSASLVRRRPRRLFTRDAAAAAFACDAAAAAAAAAALPVKRHPGWRYFPRFWEACLR